MACPSQSCPSTSGTLIAVVVPDTTPHIDFALAAGPVNAAPAITTQPSAQTVTAGNNTEFTVAASGTPAPTYQWQVSTNAGLSFSNLTNAAPYSGVTTGTLTITGASTSLHGARYRAVSTNSTGTATSNSATLTVRGAVSVTPARAAIRGHQAGARRAR